MRPRPTPATLCVPVVLLADLPSQMPAPTVHAISCTRLAIHWYIPYSDPVPSHTFEVCVFDVDVGAEVPEGEDAAPARVLTRHYHECVVDGLLPGTLYEIRVRSQNVVGWGPFTAATTVRTQCKCQ